MLEPIIEAITPLFHDWGLVIIFVATFLESSVVVASVLPGESVLLLGGFMASPSAMTRGEAPLELGPVVAVAFAGAILGDIVGYVVGRIGGRSIVRRFGRFFFLPERRLPVLERYFVSYGARAVALGRFAPFLRSVRTLVAGIARMPFFRFLVPAVLAAAVWASGIASIGFLLGESWHIANRTLGAGGIVVFVLLAVLFAMTWRRVKVRVERELGGGEDGLLDRDVEPDAAEPTGPQAPPR